MQKINFVFSSFLFCSTLISSEWWVMGERKSSKKCAHQKYLPWIIYSHTWKSAHARERMILFVTMAVFIGTASCNLYTHWLPVLLLSQFLYLSLSFCVCTSVSLSPGRFIIIFHFYFMTSHQLCAFIPCIFPTRHPERAKRKTITASHRCIIIIICRCMEMAFQTVIYMFDVCMLHMLVAAAAVVVLQSLYFIHRQIVHQIYFMASLATFPYIAQPTSKYTWTCTQAAVAAHIFPVCWHCTHTHTSTHTHADWKTVKIKIYYLLC